MNLKKKGFTLLETIVSFSLVSLLIIFVSTMISNSLKIGRKAEEKQNSTMVARQVSENIKSMNTLNVKQVGTESYLSLDKQDLKLTGQVGDKQIFEAKDYDNTGFDLKVSFEKTLKQIKAKENVHLEDYYIKKKNDDFVIEHNGVELLEIKDKITLVIYYSKADGTETSLDSYGRIAHELYAGEKKSTTPMEKIVVDRRYNPRFFVDEDFSNIIDIEVHNKTDIQIPIVINKHIKSIGTINLTTKEGTIGKYTEKYSYDKYEKNGDFYDVVVEVSKESEIYQKNNLKQNMLVPEEILLPGDITLPKPANIKGTTDSSSTININWDLPNKIESVNGGLKLIGHTIYLDGKYHDRIYGENTSYTIVGLKANTIYGVKVSAIYSNMRETNPISTSVRTKKDSKVREEGVYSGL